jgi:eukaryotic-like serine/threonine-protein kinase
MLQWILCENEHARLPDAWELNLAANEVVSCVACGAAARLQPIPPEEQREVLSGNEVPGYQILRPLAWARGAGVYQARQVQTRRLVALKVSRLGPDAAEERTSVRREAGILRQLDHRNIVGFLEAGESNGRAFFSMEWLTGPQLGERLCDGPLPLGDAIRMASGLSDAIHHIHSRRFIYGELRPSNIVYSGRGVAKLVDLESVTRRDRRGRARASGGDPRYVAPEQWQSDDQKVGPAADIFGLGAILFHALTGKLPFDGICSEDRMRQVATLPIPSVVALRPSLPAALDAICRKCLHPQPHERYAEACDLAAALRRALRAHTNPKRQRGIPRPY